MQKKRLKLKKQPFFVTLSLKLRLLIKPESNEWVGENSYATYKQEKNRMFFTIKKNKEEEEEENFRTKYYSLYPKLYRVAFRLLGNVQDAEDIVQDVFLRLWEKRSALDSVENVEAYCVRMVRNLSIDVLRSRPIIEEDLSLLGNLAIGEDNGNAAFQIEMKDAVEWVKKFLGLLPEKQKQIMMMRDMEEYSLEEIENATGLSAVHVRVLLSRARKKIREQINHIMSNEKR